MSKKIEYSKGQVVGPYGLIYIKEAEPYIQPSSQKPIRQAYFQCPHCDEHKIFITRIAYAKNGHTKSCGCKNLETSIKTIQQYNQTNPEPWNHIHYKEGEEIGEFGVIYLEDVERYISPQNKKYRQAKFQCPICGRKFVALINNVMTGKTKGCGLHNSYGEERVSNLLESLNITFERQKTFDDLLGKNNHPYFFDFYLPDYNCCIEYDGIQHFEYHAGSCWNDKANFLETQYRDKEKEQYCSKNNISLIRISYTDFNKLDKEYLLNKIQEVA